MREDIIREKICSGLTQKINKELEKIIEFCGANIKFYTIYPLIFLEEGYAEKALESIDNLNKRGTISWFISKCNCFLNTEYSDMEVIPEEYEIFSKIIYPCIAELYQNSRVLREMRDHKSIARSIIEPIDEEKNIPIKDSISC